MDLPQSSSPPRLEMLRFVPMVLVMGVVFLFSHQSGESFPLPLFSGLDKVAHAVIYGLLAATMLFAHKAANRKRYPLKTVFTTVFGCLLYGISDEIHQSFIPGRYPDVYDVAMDLVGALIVCFFWYFCLRQR